MKRAELEKWNVGENLDALMNLDPRGYGVCRILYEGSRKGVHAFTKNSKRAAIEAEWLIKDTLPSAVISVEAVEMEAEVMRVASRSGLIDMTGSLLPGIDGFNTRMNTGIVSLMRQCTAYAVRYSRNSDQWFGPVILKGFFQKGGKDIENQSCG